MVSLIDYISFNCCKRSSPASLKTALKDFEF